MTTESTTPQTEQLLTPEVLAEIEARANAATEGPWEWTYHPLQEGMMALGSMSVDKDVLLCTGNDSEAWGEISEHDAALLRHARTDIPALCRTLKAAWANELRLSKEVVELRQQVTQFSELADERHDLLSVERRENGELRFQRAQLSGRVEQLRQCLVDVGKENAALREQLARAEQEIRGILDALGEDAIHSRPDGGEEDIYESLAISVVTLQSRARAAKAFDAITDRSLKPELAEALDRMKDERR